MACCTSINPPTLPNGTVGSIYNQPLTPQPGGCTNPVILDSGGLPPGLSLVGNTISGTPTTPGTFNFDLSFQGGPGCFFSPQLPYSITITAAEPTEKKRHRRGRGAVSPANICFPSDPNNPDYCPPPHVRFIGSGTVYELVGKDPNGNCCYRIVKRR